MSATSLAQSFEFVKSFGEFERATSFYITAAGFIYVTDTDLDEAFKIDTLGNLIKSFGGYGWSDNSFDDPIDIYADPLTIYITDMNNHKIKRFDKNLNFISALYKRESENQEEQFGYPLSCASSNQGDLYILDSENNRVVKLDIFGNFIQNFGGFDAGKYQLKNPKSLAVSSNSNIFVLDDMDLIVFDQYGNGIGKLTTEINLNTIRILFDQVTINSDDEILFADLKNSELKFIKLELSGIEDFPEIVSSIIFSDKLYVLTPQTILIFQKFN
jgi:hypothetical protein